MLHAQMKTTAPRRHARGADAGAREHDRRPPTASGWLLLAAVAAGTAAGLAADAPLTLPDSAPARVEAPAETGATPIDEGSKDFALGVGAAVAMLAFLRRKSGGPV